MNIQGFEGCHFLNGERSGEAADISGSDSRTSLLNLFEAAKPAFGFAYPAGVPELCPARSSDFCCPNGVRGSDFSLGSFCYLEILAFAPPGLCGFVVLAGFACGAFGLLIPI